MLWAIFSTFSFLLCCTSTILHNFFFFTTNSFLLFQGNTTSGDNYTQLPGKEERVRLVPYYDEDRKVNVTDGELKIDEVNMGDRGEYICIGESEDGQRFNMTSAVRIKGTRKHPVARYLKTFVVLDKYAALWPFLGICAEVFVLCAIIFIYEKKRNKTELEESDTDQSPDQ